MAGCWDSFLNVGVGFKGFALLVSLLFVCCCGFVFLFDYCVICCFDCCFYCFGFRFMSCDLFWVCFDLHLIGCLF